MPILLINKSYQTIKIRKDIENLQPDFGIISKLGSRGLICSAKGDNVDFVSRCFYPQYGINEDPATGSAHGSLSPFWANKFRAARNSRSRISALRRCRRPGVARGASGSILEESNLESGVIVTVNHK